MMLLGVLCWLAAAETAEKSRERAIGWGLAVAAVVAVVTPWLWTTYRPRWLPWPLESYINGVHIYAQPQPWLFPIFPWIAFAFVGLALGFLLFSGFAKKSEAWFFAAAGGAGAVAFGVSPLLGGAPGRVFSAGSFDFFHTRPPFFLVRSRIFLSTPFFF